MKENKKQDGFRNKWGFIMACIGSAIGMANIWRFPAMVSLYGGLTFLIPYFIFVVIIGSSGVMEEFAFGRWGGAGPVGTFGKATQERSGNRRIGELFGALPVIGSMGLAIGYSVVMGWIFKYVKMSLTGELTVLGQDMNAIGASFGATAPEADSLAESISMVLGGAGNHLWIGVAILVSVVIMSLGIAGGIEKACKVMMPLLFGLFLVLAVYVAVQPNAMAGYRYMFSLNTAGLANPKVWIYAFGQAFFSLSVAGNGSIIYGSYLSEDVEIGSSARNVALFDTLAAMLAAVVIIPAMAASGQELTSGGPGLMFVTLVNVFNGMGAGRIVGIVFFLCVMVAGVSSIINLYETPAAFLQEKFHMNRVPAVVIVHAIGFFVAIFMQAYTSQWMDLVSIYICPFGALLAGVMFFWVLKKETAMEAVNLGSEKPVGSWFHTMGKYVYCPLCILCLIAGALLGGIG